MPEKYAKADLRFTDRKKIHPIVVRKNVRVIDINSFGDGRFRSGATGSKWTLFLEARRYGTKYKAFNAPQKINVQLAPCHNPLTRNMMIVFLTVFAFPWRLPPKGK